MPPPLDDEIRYRLLKLLEERPHLTQRELAKAMGISLGKVNYCLRQCVENGWVKVKRFSKSKHKRGYMYLLTPKGLYEKSLVTVRFLKLKLREYEELRREIERLTREVRARGDERP